MRKLQQRASRSNRALAEAIERRQMFAVGAPIGFGAAATGGAAGPTVTVTTVADFKTQVAKAGPLTIRVQGALDIGDVRVTADKTIEGDGDDTLTGTLQVRNVSNVIIQNLTITNPAGAGEGDAITIKDNARNVWVDHVTAFDTTDGLIDVSNGSDLVTLSWNKFYYTRNSGHNFSVLIGSSDSRTSDRGTLRVTLHHNWWGAGVVERMPSVRYGDVHVYNNYYNAAGNNYAIRSRVEAEVLIQNNAFENVKDPYYVYVADEGETIGKIKASGNQFTNTTGRIDDGNDAVFTPGYAFALDAAASVKSSVTAGAGARRLTATPAQLTGAAIGTAGSYANSGNTIARAVDGNLTTFFDAPAADGAFVGLDLGAASTVTSVQFAPRAGWESRMVGGVFQGSTSANFSTGVATLATVASRPAGGKLTTLNVSGAAAYRYVRYLSPAGSFGNVAEVKFFGRAGGTAPTTATPLAGATIGTAGSFNNAGNTAAKLFDGQLSTFFDAPVANAWAGLDLGTPRTITSIRYAPRAGWAYRMTGGRFEGSNSATFASGVVTLATIATKPAEGALTSVGVTNPGTFRYVRYLAPAGSYGNASEVQFFG